MKAKVFTDTAAASLQAGHRRSPAHLIVFHLTDGHVAVAAQHGVDRPTYVEVVLLGVEGVRIIHDLPVVGGCGV